MKHFEYSTDGADIYRNSFAIIHEESDPSRFDADEETVTVRIIHVTGQTDLTKDIVPPPGAVCAVRQALKDGAPIFIDANMVASGITRKRLPADNEITCLLCDGRAPELVQELDTTRAVAAVELQKTCLEDTVVAIGDAPTALFHLLNRINKESFPIPVAVLAVPVGFVSVAESKRTTISPGTKNPELKCITVTGCRGGSAITYAALSAIATAKEIL